MYYINIFIIYVYIYNIKEIKKIDLSGYKPVFFVWGGWGVSYTQMNLNANIPWHWYYNPIS